LGVLFRAIKDWKKNKSKYRGRPSLPKYIRKDKHLLIFPNQSIILKNNRLKNRKFGINIKLPQKDYKDFSNFLQVRIIPNHSLYDVEIVYNEPIKNHGLDSNKYLSIDLGINNLVTAISNDKNIKPLIIDGRPLKAINQLYNKKISKLKSIRTNGHNVQNKEEKKYFKQTKRIEILEDKNKISKLADGIQLKKQDLTEVKLAINRYVREIDECLKLLNQIPNNN